MEKIISWVEIPAENFERAVNFYNVVLISVWKEWISAKKKWPAFLRVKVQSL